MAGSRKHSARRVARSVWPLENARAAFDMLSAGAHPVTVDVGLSGFGDRPVGLGELRESLLDRRCPQATRDRVWVILIGLARDEGGVWRTACVGMALPGLVATTGRLAALYKVDPAGVASDVLYGFLAALPAIDVGRFGVSARLQWAAFNSAREVIRRELNAPTPIGDSFVSHPPAAPWGHPDFVLARAVAASVLTAGEADLIGATRLERIALGDYAAERRTRVEAVLKQRQRAERRLVAWLADSQTGAAGTIPDDAVPAQYAGTHPTYVGRPLSKRSQPVVDLRPPRGKKASSRVSENASGNQVLQCGGLPPSPGGTTPAETTKEARRCA